MCMYRYTQPWKTRHHISLCTLRVGHTLAVTKHREKTGFDLRIPESPLMLKY